MESPRLKVVEPGARPAGRPGGAAIWIAPLLLACGLFATLRGADAVRGPDSSRADAETIAGLSLSEGSRAPATLAAVGAFRDRLVQRPLDSRRRAQYGALLLDLGDGPEDARAAEFHAARAVALAPVTVPTLRLAARTLVRTGDRETALLQVRTMFGFDPPAAARLLQDLRPWLYPGEWRRALPDDPDAWLAWFVRLRQADRPADSLVVLAESRERWPDHLPSRVAEVRLAFRAGDAAALTALLPADAVLPETEAAAPLFAVRAWLHARAGRTPAAEQDLAAAARLDTASLFVAKLRGDALELLGRPEAAREAWLAALFRYGDASAARRIELLGRLARLEESRGRHGTALRHWRTVLELAPEHREAERAVRRLTGPAG